MNDPRTRAQTACDDFNALNPVGTPVTLTYENGSRFETTTRSGAFVFGREPVVFLERVRGPRPLSQVTAKEAVDG